MLLCSREAHTSTHGGVRKSYPGFTCALAIVIGESSDGQREVEQLHQAEDEARETFDRFAPVFSKRLQAFASDQEVAKRWGAFLDVKAKAPHPDGHWGGNKSVDLTISGLARDIVPTSPTEPARRSSSDFHVTLHLRNAEKLSDGDRQRLAWDFVRYEAIHAPWLPMPDSVKGNAIEEALASRLEFFDQQVSLEALATAAQLRAALALIAADPKRLPLRSDGDESAKQRMRNEALLRALSWDALLTGSKKHHPEVVAAFDRLVALSPGRIPELLRSLIGLAPAGGEKALIDALRPSIEKLPRAARSETDNVLKQFARP